MGKVNLNLQAKVTETAIHLKSDSTQAAYVLNKLSELLSEHGTNADLYIIYNQLYNSFKNDDEFIEELQEKFIDFIKKFNFKYTPLEGIEQLSPHQFITAHLFRGIMMENDREDFAMEFESIAQTLGNHINQLFDESGNTPLIWGIANSRLSNLHQLLDAIEKNGLIDDVSFDVHCKQFCQGSALFLACLKGEKHQDIDKPNSLNPLMEMGSIIKKLIHFNASSTDKSGELDRYSPLEIMVMRRSLPIVKLMVEQLEEPLNEEELQRLKELLDINFNQMKEKITDLSVVCTIPLEEKWMNDLDPMQSFIKNLDALNNERHENNEHLSRRC